MLITIYTCIHVLHMGYLHRELRAIFYVHCSLALKMILLLNKCLTVNFVKIDYDNHYN